LKTLKIPPNPENCGIANLSRNQSLFIYEIEHPNEKGILGVSVPVWCEHWCNVYAGEILKSSLIPLLIHAGSEHSVVSMAKILGIVLNVFMISAPIMY